MRARHDTVTVANKINRFKSQSAQSNVYHRMIMHVGKILKGPAYGDTGQLSNKALCEPIGQGSCKWELGTGNRPILREPLKILPTCHVFFVLELFLSI